MSTTCSAHTMNKTMGFKPCKIVLDCSFRHPDNRCYFRYRNERIFLKNIEYSRTCFTQPFTQPFT